MYMSWFRFCVRVKVQQFALCFETPVTSPPIWLEDSDGTNDLQRSRVLSGFLDLCPLEYKLILKGQASLLSPN